MIQMMIWIIGSQCQELLSRVGELLFIIDTVVLLVCCVFVLADADLTVLSVGCTSLHCRTLCHVVKMNLLTSTSLCSQRFQTVRAGKCSVY